VIRRAEVWYNRRVARRAVTAAVLLGIAIPNGALADHSHHHDAATTDDADTSMMSASLGLMAATYRTMSFEGDYQGMTPGLHWANARFAASTGIGTYRLRKNGALYHGVGDLFVHGQVTLLGHHARSAGLAFPISLPTGSQREGLGMGHVMVMPALWGSWATGGLTLAGSAGYGRAIGASQDSDHPHGTGPIVDPMNISELTWSASGDYAVARALRLGARMEGAIALDDTGVHRTIGAARAVWTAGRFDTKAEVQFGIAGDPFQMRGVIETALRF